MLGKHLILADQLIKKQKGNPNLLIELVATFIESNEKLNDEVKMLRTELNQQRIFKS